MFVQIHTLSSYPGVLLNRDDAGLAKRLPFGDAERLRISSQCLKRHWRTAEDEWSLESLGVPMAVRSREAVERDILPTARLSCQDEAALSVAGDAVIRHLYGNGKKVPPLKERQALLLGTPELNYLAAVVATAANEGGVEGAAAIVDAKVGKGDGKLNMAVIKETAGNLAAGLEAALFGRMVTSDKRANVDAAIHVAHSFTVHKSSAEVDYFTVVDDLRSEAGESGSGGMFDTELTSGTYYGYVVVDARALVKNLGGDRDLAKRVVESLVHLIATVSPGAKKGSTAPYAYADMVLVETGTRQPRTLANAFRKSVPLRGDVAESAMEALVAYLKRVDECYGPHENRALSTTLEAAAKGKTVSLNDLALGAGVDAASVTLAVPHAETARIAAA